MATKKVDGTVSISDKVVDMTKSQRGVWLVKVPKYISKKWNKCTGNTDIGCLNLTRYPGQKPEIKLILSEAVLGLEGDEDTEVIPKEHVLKGTAVHEQTLAVFSQHTVAEPGSFIETEQIELEGKVIQRLECKQQFDSKYMKLKMDSLIKASIPNRKTIQVKGLVQTYRPVSDHKNNIEYEEKQKNEGKKFRDEKEKVHDKLFAAFEKHQYYNIKDLVNITKQPVGYLKEILREICDYNMKPPHKNTWSLKPEYYQP